MQFNYFAKASTLIAALLVFNNCSRNPVTGKKELSFMSESQELALGQESDPSIQAEFGVYPDSLLQQYLTIRGKEMAKISHRPNLDFQFKVMDSEVVNAFAVPGGYVYFTRGILAHFNNEAQMMGVLGHEIGHVTARHGAQQQTKQILLQGGLIVGMIASPKFAQYAEQASQGLQLLMLKYSRDHESQSDKLGVEYSSRTGYDAKEMAGFFQTIGRIQEAAGANIPTFLSTHPDPGDRYKNVTAMAIAEQQANPNKSYDVNRDGYLRRIDGIVYGEDPRQGYVDNNNFYHPELKFEFPIPSAWKTHNSPTQFQMASSDQKAMMILTLAPEKTLSEAANAIVQKHKLKVVDQRNTTINGLQAIVQIGDQVPENAQNAQQATQNTVRVMTTFIAYNGMNYIIHGVAGIADFPQYERTFLNTMNGFRALTDYSKINVTPYRVRIKTVYNDATLQEALRSFNTPDSKLKELAILNGMELTDRVTRGMLIKTIEK
ncbi:MAG: M48 family metalloprotease [Saprospiraceae bacterium]|nr:M48 family metalloprotease [Saprospiraceae bacterium]